MGRWFVNQGDALRANVISSLATAIVVFVTILTPDGEYRRVRSNVPFTTNGTRVAETAVILISTLPEGEVLSMNIATFTPNVKRGQCYVVAYVIEQPTMAAGYVFANHDVLLGDNVDPGPAGGHGNLVSNSLAQPGAGADFGAISVPSGANWKPRGIQAQLVSAVGAGNREFVIQYKDTGGNLVGGNVANENQAASTTSDYYGAVGNTPSGVSAALTGGAVGIGVSDILLFAAYIISFKTHNIQGADQWGAGRLLVEEWLVL